MKENIARIQEEHAQHIRTVFGFWVYIMSDCALFASLFATFAVLHQNTFGGPGARELFSLPFVLFETIILLTSSFTAGLGLLSANHARKNQTIFWFAVTLLLGLSFLALELIEFAKLVGEGNGWQRSGFLSAFFTLVGTHGAHVLSGSLWMIVLMAQTFIDGITPVTLRRLTCLSLFWHFLDIVWIFIFSIVYLMPLI